MLSIHKETHFFKNLYAQQVLHVNKNPKLDAHMDYVSSHFAQDFTIVRQIRVAEMIMPYLKGRVLDFGCHHGFDACVYKLRHMDALELYGCDVVSEQAYQPFYHFSGIQYKQVTHPYLLDYTDEYFDVVVSNGVLEHVMDDMASLRELYRVLKPSCTLIVTCLPNYYSYTEWVQRKRHHPSHDRLYTVFQVRKMLKEVGFSLVHYDRFFMLPTLLGGFSDNIKRIYQYLSPVVSLFNNVLENTPLLNHFSSNLFFVARKNLM